MKWSFFALKTALLPRRAKPALKPTKVAASHRTARLAAVRKSDAERTSPSTRDTRLTKDVATALSRHPYGAYDWVTVTGVHAGNVALAGRVRRESQREEYERIVATVPGVRRVFNDITLLPPSAYDDELRAAALRAFRRYPRLRAYCAPSVSRIHVLVEYGDVTLEGRVRDQADKQFVEDVVRSQVRPFEVVNNLNVEHARDTTPLAE